jgi:hypothetical protein
MPRGRQGNPARPSTRVKAGSAARRSIDATGCIGFQCWLESIRWLAFRSDVRLGWANPESRWHDMNSGLPMGVFQ